MNRASFSTTSRSATPALRMERVRPPGPGPTSHTWAPFKLPAWRTSLSESTTRLIIPSRDYFQTASQHIIHCKYKRHILINHMSALEFWASRLRLIPFVLQYWCLIFWVMKMRHINLTVTLPKDKQAHQTCTASLIIILLLQLSGAAHDWSTPFTLAAVLPRSAT